MTSDDRSRSQQQDALVRDLKKEILELRTQLEQVPVPVPEDGPMPGGGIRSFFLNHKKKRFFFQGGTPRKIRCSRKFQLHVFVVGNELAGKIGENFTEVPRFAQHLYGSRNGFGSQCRNHLHIQQPPPFLRIQQPPPLVTEYYY